MRKINTHYFKILIFSIIFALSSLILTGCEINAGFILKIYNQTTSTNSYGYEQTCVINFNGSDFITKSSILKINGELLELNIVENTLGDLNDDESIVTSIQHIYFDATFKYEKQGDIFVKTKERANFNNDNKVKLKTNYLKNIKLTNLKDEHKTLLEASIKDANISDVFNTDDLSNAKIKILFNNNSKKVEQVILSYLSKNNNIVTITTNYYKTGQEIILPNI